jgi:hypothetical protein
MNLERISTSGGSFNKGQAEIRTIGKVLNWSTFEKTCGNHKNLFNVK